MNNYGSFHGKQWSWLPHFFLYQGWRRSVWASVYWIPFHSHSCTYSCYSDQIFESTESVTSLILYAKLKVLQMKYGKKLIVLATLHHEVNVGKLESNKGSQKCIHDFAYIFTLTFLNIAANFNTFLLQWSKTKCCFFSSAVQVVVYSTVTFFWIHYYLNSYLRGCLVFLSLWCKERC